MGIRGLTTYVEEHKRSLFKETNICNHCFVIDGNSLLHFLYEENQLDIRHGGDYGQFRKIIADFFINLQQCSIVALVVFDGAFDVNKRATHLHRMQNYVSYLPGLMSQKERSHILPLLAVNLALSSPLEIQYQYIFSTTVREPVFQDIQMILVLRFSLQLRDLNNGEAFEQTLDELNLPYVYTLQDADRDVASIANDINAYVLSNDSDFYVFPLVCGYIPLKHFVWNKIFHHDGKCCLRGDVFKSSNLSHFCKVSSSTLAHLTVIMGCDWIRPEVFFEFTNTLMQYTRTGNRRGKNCSRINSTLIWLSEHKSDESILKDLRKFIKSDEISKTMDWCLDFYRNLPRSYESQRVLKDKLYVCLSQTKTGQTKVMMENCWKKLSDKSVKESKLVTLTRYGIFPNTMLNLDDENSTMLLPIIVGKPFEESPHRCSFGLRASSSRLMRVDKTDEYDRRGKEYIKIKAPKTISRCACRTGYEMMTTPERFTNPESGAERKSSRKYILETLLGCEQKRENHHKEFESFSTTNKDLEFLLAVFLFWIKNTDPPPAVACAVALNSLDFSSDHETRLRLTFVGKSKDVMDTAYVHCISQWQSCIKYAITLNRMLSCPLQEPTILFNCTFIAHLFCSIAKVKDGIIHKVSDKLSPFPNLKSRFQKLSKVIHQCTDKKAFVSFDGMANLVKEMDFCSTTRRARQKRKTVDTILKRYTKQETSRPFSTFFLIILSLLVLIVTWNSF